MKLIFLCLDTSDLYSTWNNQILLIRFNLIHNYQISSKTVYKPVIQGTCWNDEPGFSLDSKAAVGHMYLEQAARKWILKLSCELITRSERPGRSQEARKRLRKMTLISTWKLGSQWNLSLLDQLRQSDVPSHVKQIWYFYCALAPGAITRGIYSLRKHGLLLLLQLHPSHLHKVNNMHKETQIITENCNYVNCTI